MHVSSLWHIALRQASLSKAIAVIVDTQIADTFEQSFVLAMGIPTLIRKDMIILQG